MLFPVTGAGSSDFPDGPPWRSGMDVEWQKLLALLLLIALFLLSCVLSYEELRYRISGKRAEASIITLSDVYRERVPTVDISGRVLRLAVTYEFADVDGSERLETSYIDPRWPIDADSGVVDVEFIPHRPGFSRVTGTGTLTWVWVMSACLGLIGLGVAAFFCSYYRSRRLELRRVS